MANTKDTQTGKLQLNLSLPTPDPNKPAPALRAYLFDSAGRLVHHATAAEKVEFAIDPAKHYRVTVGPDMIGREKQPPENLAQKLLASSPMSRDYVPLLKNSAISMEISASSILIWLRHCVNVHGSVRKRLGTGGFAPICTGKVQIFRIDLAASLDRLSPAGLTNLKNVMLSRILNREIADIIAGNFGDLAVIAPLAAGLIPLSGAGLKNYIVAHRAELAQFMCNVIPEYDIVYEQYADAPIQSDGTFSETICFWIWESQDVYFEVVQTLDGVEREIADPDILCTTMFNYDGSQAAVITVDDPNAVACFPDPYPGPNYLYVWPTAIGNEDLGNIDGLETGLGTGLLPGPRPWGGTLPLQMQFHPDLQANDIIYYRWSYNFDGTGSDFTDIVASVTHRWQEITIDGMGNPVIHLHGYTFGPHLVGAEPNLFEIPNPSLPWIDINDPVDRPFAYFDSANAANPRNGMCTLKLQMFNSAGVRVSSSNAGHAGSFKYILPAIGGPVGTYTSATAPNIDANGDLIFRIYVDNNPTHAALYDARTGSHGSGDACGIRHYSGGNDPVTITYAATQPENFIDWGLSVNKGTAGTVASISGHTSSPDPASFTNNASVLLGSCTQAAFAVNLNCYARATNGYSTQTQYNSSATLAFALLTP